MIEISYIKDLVTIFSFIIGVTYYIMNLRNQHKARQAQLFMQLHTRFGSHELLNSWNDVMTREWKTIDEYNSKYTEKTEMTNFAVIMNFFELFGGLLKNNLMDADLVYEIVPTNGNTFWNKYESYANHIREEGDWPHFMRPIEYLADEMSKIAMSRREVSGEALNVMTK